MSVSTPLQIIICILKCYMIQTCHLTYLQVSIHILPIQSIYLQAILETFFCGCKYINSTSLFLPKPWQMRNWVDYSIRLNHCLQVLVRTKTLHKRIQLCSFFPCLALFRNGLVTSSSSLWNQDLFHYNSPIFLHICYPLLWVTTFSLCCSIL